MQGLLAHLIQHGLSQAHAMEYVLRTQERRLAPVLACFRRVHLGHIQVEELLHSLLDQLPERPLKAQGSGDFHLNHNLNLRLESASFARAISHSPPPQATS